MKVKHTLSFLFLSLNYRQIFKCKEQNSRKRNSLPRACNGQGLQRVYHERRRNTSWRTAAEKKQLEEVNKKLSKKKKRERERERERERD